MHRLPILLALAACHPSPSPAATVHSELVYSASQGYGVQPIGEDKGVVYAFVKIDAPAPSKIAIADIHLERDGVACARPTKQPRFDRIDAVTTDTASRALTLAALSNSMAFDGNLVAGSTYVRIEVEVDHMCGGAGTMPDVAVHLDDGETLVHRIVESMAT